MSYCRARLLPVLLLSLSGAALPSVSRAAGNTTPTGTPVTSATPTSTPTPFPTEPAQPAAPTALWASPDGSSKSIPAGGWINARTVDLHFHLDVTAGTVQPQVEIRAWSGTLQGRPNFAGPNLTASGEATVRVNGLVNGTRYQWQARVVQVGALASPWTVFGGPSARTFAFGDDRVAPRKPAISSSTDPNQTRWYNTRNVSLSWSSSDRPSGIAGYSFVMQRRPHAVPPGATTTQHSVVLSSLQDGVWYVAIRAVDRAGNWSPTATFRLQLDRQAPRLVWLSPQHTTLNPYRGGATESFRLTKSANVQVDVYRVGSKTPVSSQKLTVAGGRTTTISWSGKDSHGKPLTKGYYFFTLTAVDHAGNAIVAHPGGIRLIPEAPHAIAAGQVAYPGEGKRIIVSLSRQELYAYDGDKLVLETVVTTGNPALPTPLGHFTVLARYHPYEFISPWPEGSPYYYPPSLSEYAMLFRQGGYFLHDAPWRSAFGPGTNGPGQPGTNYGGTHGCVNIPSSPMLFLWNWTPIGTPVDVVP